MRILYLDCYSGIAGDMLLGALLDLGLDPALLRRKLRSLPVKGYTITSRTVLRQGISGTKLDVRIGKGHHHRGWKEIRQILSEGDLDADVQEKALEIFRRLIQAEARIHRVPMQKVHLHEVGAVDAIVDIVGAVVGLEEILGARGKLHVSPLHLGRGRVKIAHGTFPIPAPATAELLKGIPVEGGPVEGELVTPTGAAIVSTLADRFGPMPPMEIEAIGYGAGTREYEGHPNLLRAVLGEHRRGEASEGEVLVVQCNIDDMNPQGYGHLMERLFDEGALEVYYTPVQMKKNRPGTLVSVICPERRFSAISALLFRESTTIGLRYTRAGRVELHREEVQVRTVHGKVRIKISSFQGSPVQAQPEYEDCRKLSRSRGVPLKEVMAAALAAYRGQGEVSTQPAPSRGTRAASAGRKKKATAAAGGSRKKSAKRSARKRPSGRRTR